MFIWAINECKKYAKFLNGFFFQKMSFIQNTDNFLAVNSPDNLNLFLQLAFGIFPVKL